MLAQGQYNIIERTMIYLESSPHIFGELPFALNDCTLLKRDTSSMVTIHTFLNGGYLKLPTGAERTDRCHAYRKYWLFA